MKENEKIGCGTISLPNAVFIVFLVLKLTGKIDWSWWWVTSPLWISAVFLLLLVILVIIVLYIKE